MCVYRYLLCVVCCGVLELLGLVFPTGLFVGCGCLFGGLLLLNGGF